METKSDFKENLAKFISFLFNPILMILWAGIGMSFALDIPITTLLFILAPFGIAVFSYVIVIVFIKKTADLDFTDVKTRPPLLVLASLALFSSALIASSYDLVASDLLINFLIILILTTAISFRWKISLHAIGYTSTVLLFYLLFGPQMLWLLILLPLIYWSRIKLHKHDIWQLLAGSLLSFLMLL